MCTYLNQSDIKHMATSGNKSLLHILQKANRSATEPEVGELTNYSLTYGTSLNETHRKVGVESN